MDIRKTVLKNLAVIGIGQCIGVGAMIGMFALLGYFTLSVVWGGLAGAVLAMGNYFMMAVVTALASQRAQKGDVAGGKKLIKGSYPIRLLVLGVLLFLFAKSGVCNVIALVLPLVFVYPTIYITEFFRKKEV